MVNDTEDLNLPLDEDDIALLNSPPYLGEITVEENGSAQCGDDDSDVITAPDVFPYTHVPPKKRHYVRTSDSFKSFEWLNNEDACVVCDIADSFVVPCSGNGCHLAVHRTCVEFGCEDPAMSYCPFCWFKNQEMRSMVVEAAKALIRYGCSKAKDMEKSLPMHLQLQENLDLINEIVKQVKARNSQLEVDMEKVQQTTCRQVSFLISDRPKRVLWTVKEEEMLRMGVELYASKINKNMPWRKILEMGKGIFHNARKPSDLKDKWKNIAHM
ncbi:hypothetical protein V5N11_035502 [Cardamine amara subsp. amara]|uniref:Myb-like domain-containing protein n=1 Tax=Cardamine amara subsp. amara TaxID=228776 RepID=A0ABD1BU22_CARAN